MSHLNRLADKGRYKLKLSEKDNRKGINNFQKNNDLYKQNERRVILDFVFEWPDYILFIYIIVNAAFSILISSQLLILFQKDLSFLGQSQIFKIIIALPIFIIFSFLFKIAHKRYISNQINNLKKLPYPFNIENYIDILSSERLGKHLQIQLFFLNSLEDDVKELLSLASLGALSVLKSQWENNHLTVVSPEKVSYIRRKYNSPLFTHKALHQWFIQFERKFLRVIIKEYPLEHINIMVI